jgi:hypothetical protein
MLLDKSPAFVVNDLIHSAIGTSLFTPFSVLASIITSSKQQQNTPKSKLKPLLPSNSSFV